MGPLRAIAALTAVVVVLIAPAAAFAHPDVVAHRQDDVSARKTPEQERAMVRATQAATAADAQAAALAVTGTEDEVGAWSAPVDWPVVGVHVALLPNGKVLAYDSVGDTATENYP